MILEPMESLIRNFVRRHALASRLASSVSIKEMVVARRLTADGKCKRHSKDVRKCREIEDRQIKCYL